MAAVHGRKRRLEAYLSRLGETLGHADRRKPCADYVTGLLLPGDRKSMEPLAARVEPKRVSSTHQALHHFVSEARWDERRLLSAARAEGLPALEQSGGIGIWAVDDTGIPKKGSASVGVSRQYCGVLGKQENCQVAVSVTVANERASLPVAWRLYLPEAWAGDAERRRRAKVPEAVEFRRKWEIALTEIDWLLQEQVPRAPVVADAGYGQITAFRDGLSQRKLEYVVGVLAEQGVRSAACRGARSCQEVARALPATAWQQITWREGSRGEQRSRFAAVRVQATHSRSGREPSGEEWLLVEWPEDAPEPTKYALSTLAPRVTLRDLVRTFKLRWRIERDYQEMKDELGLDHFEGRSWPGFHHHGALCFAAYAFIAAERVRAFPPTRATFLPPRSPPSAFRPRGAPVAHRRRS